MLNNHAAYKYETPYKGPFLITLCLTNGTVNLQYCPTKIRYCIRPIKPYKSDINVEDINTKNKYDNVRICSPVIYFRVVFKLVKKVYNRMRMETLALSYIGRTDEVFMIKFFNSHCMRLFRIGDALRRRVLTVIYRS